jgi:hypothetical protein
MIRARRAATTLAACCFVACQSPTDPDEVPDYLEVAVSPDPAPATGPTGRFYVVTKADGTDERREYDWKATFTVTVRLTSAALDDNVGIELPVDVTAATIRVQQASGGIVTPPTGSEMERYEFVITNSTSNRFVAVDTDVSMTFDVWYDLPNERREALVTAQLSFRDDGNFSFQENVPVRIAP